MPSPSRRTDWRRTKFGRLAPAIALLIVTLLPDTRVTAQEAEGDVRGKPTSVFDIPEDDEWLDPPREDAEPSSLPDAAEGESADPEVPADPEIPVDPEGSADSERVPGPDLDPPPTDPEPEPDAPVVAPPPERKVRVHVPAKAAQARAERVVREVFAKEYAGKRAAEKSALAKRLLAEAPTERDPAVRYVLLREARNAAAAGGDGRRVVEAVLGLTESFRLRGRQMLLDGLVAAGKADTTATELRSTALALMDLAGSDDLTYAAAAAAAADATARRSKDSALVARAKAKVSEVGALSREFASVRAATAALQSNRKDRAANLEVGRFLCFVRGRWAKGLPLLAAGADPALAKLAKRELARPVGEDKQRALADAWWDAAAAFKEPAKSDARARACHWYAKLHPRLTGISRVTVEKRMIEALTARLRPGLVGRLYPTHSFSRGWVERIDKTINFNWGVAAPAAGIPPDNFGGLWRGYIKAPSAGKYRIVTENDDGVRLWIDEKLVIDQWHCLQAPLYTADVEMSGTPQTIQIEFPECAGHAWLRLSWAAPGAKKPKLVPATALFHQPAGRGYVVRPRPENSTMWGGHAYALMPQQLTWHSANQWCEEMGGHLTVIESAAEQGFLVGLVAGTHPWIGLSDEDENGVYRWVDGTLPRYAAWCPGDPHGLPGMPHLEDHVMLWEGGQWGDCDWGFGQGFICEWDD